MTDYADNIDARQYDQRLRGPIDERRELAIDERTGLKHYIATENINITTSAGLIRTLFRKSIELGRRYKQTKNEADFFEALRLLGTGCHCLEDYSAHSNYVELALVELGERDVFPHVGRRTQVQLPGVRHPVYPIVTGTFGGVDFLHSVMGEFSDKATQSELQELEGTMQNAQGQDVSVLKELLDKLPSGLIGGGDQGGKADELQANAAAAKMQNMHISPKEPEDFTKQMEDIQKQIYPILEFHDNLMRSITETIDNIPILPDLIEEIQSQLNVFVFSLLAPFIMPVVSQLKEELQTGSSEVIQSSKAKQLIVFRDDQSTDPTHSMLSKDHFSNVLNEPAGKVASQVLKWVVPQIVACWDDERVDIRQTNDRIIYGIFHHPALRESGDNGVRDGRMQMFNVVEQWWGELGQRQKQELRSQLSRDGVEQGRNHKEGVQDSGHGCGKPLGMQGGMGHDSAGNSGRPSQAGRQASQQFGDSVGQAVGGGALGSIVGGLAGAVGGGLLGSAFGGGQAETKTYKTDSYDSQGSHTTRLTETGHRPAQSGQQERWGQAEVTNTQYASGGHREDYQRYEQDGRQGQTGYGFQQSTEVRPSGDGGYEQRTERRTERPGGEWESQVQEQRVTSDGRQYGQRQEEHRGNRQHDGGDDEHHGSQRRDDNDNERLGGRKQNDSDDDDDDDSDDYEKKAEKRRKKEEKKARKEREEREERDHARSNYGEDRQYGERDDSRQQQSYGQSQQSSGHSEPQYGQQEQGYGQGEQRYGGGREAQSYGRQERSKYGEQSSSGRSGNSRQGGGYDGSSSGYGEQSYVNQGGEQSYGNQRDEHQSRRGRNNDSYGQSQQSGGYGGGQQYGESEQRMPGGFGDDDGELNQSGGYGQERRY